jgi:hypothetical protein
VLCSIGMTWLDRFVRFDRIMGSIFVDLDRSVFVDSIFVDLDRSVFVDSIAFLNYYRSVLCSIVVVELLDRLVVLHRRVGKCLSIDLKSKPIYCPPILTL